VVEIHFGGKRFAFAVGREQAQLDAGESTVKVTGPKTSALGREFESLESENL